MVSSIITVYSDTISTTDYNLSGRMTAVSLQSLPTTNVSYAELPSYAPMDYQKVVNHSLADGTTTISNAYYRDFVKPSSSTRALARQAVSYGETFYGIHNDTILLPPLTPIAQTYTIPNTFSGMPATWVPTPYVSGSLAISCDFRLNPSAPRDGFLGASVIAKTYMISYDEHYNETSRTVYSYLGPLYIGAQAMGYASAEGVHYHF